jgi:flagellar basal-body rod protein FlgB
MPASGAAALMTTRSGHLTGTQGQAPGPAMLYRVPLQSAVDGNTVDLDTERAGFAENAVRYEASVRFLNGQIRQMLTAINGQ